MPQINEISWLLISIKVFIIYITVTIFFDSFAYLKSMKYSEFNIYYFILF